MNKFEKCKTCDKFRYCEYLRKGDTCNGRNYSITTNESACECIQGKTVDVELKQSDCDVRLDLVVEKKRFLKLWGQVKDTHGAFVEDALVTLFKPQYIRGEIEYLPISTTISDCMGFYQFEIDQLEKDLKYRVSVGKS